MINVIHERQGDAMDRIVLSLLVDNTAGVLARVALLSAVADIILRALQ